MGCGQTVMDDETCKDKFKKTLNYVISIDNYTDPPPAPIAVSFCGPIIPDFPYLWWFRVRPVISCCPSLSAQKTRQRFGVAQALVCCCLSIPLTCHCGPWHGFAWVSQCFQVLLGHGWGQHRTAGRLGRGGHHPLLR